MAPGDRFGFTTIVLAPRIFWSSNSPHTPLVQLAHPGDAPRPRNMYGVCKSMGETLGRYYSDKFGLSFFAIRLGGVLDTDRPSTRRLFPGWLSQRDLISLIELCLSAPPTLQYEVFEAISNNDTKWRDTSHTIDTLGWSVKTTHSLTLALVAVWCKYMKY